ncbi:MAG: hypothetical protein FJW39_02755 [Acidobacteria bacterium]|nr:hypothetical protein [Acidobacteriota bacterium]
MTVSGAVSRKLTRVSTDSSAAFPRPSRTPPAPAPAPAPAPIPAPRPPPAIAPIAAPIAAPAPTLAASSFVEDCALRSNGSVRSSSFCPSAVVSRVSSIVRNAVPLTRPPLSDWMTRPSARALRSAITSPSTTRGSDSVAANVSPDA